MLFKKIPNCVLLRIYQTIHVQLQYNKNQIFKTSYNQSRKPPQKPPIIFINYSKSTHKFHQHFTVHTKNHIQHKLRTKPSIFRIDSVCVHNIQERESRSAHARENLTTGPGQWKEKIIYSCGIRRSPRGRGERLHN